jgi:serine/threonine protein phosphatase PrpC
MTTRHINFSCQGESHKATNKVCQDYSYSAVYENGLAIAIVCDGHGGQRYFRSDVGARFATEITEKNILFFVDNIDKSLFMEKPYTAVSSIATQVDHAEFNKENAIDKALRQLFSSIIFDWLIQIKEHAANTPLTETEKASGIKAEWIDDFNAGNSLEKVYGCTLMVYIQTPDYWFSFHIGDGKCISFDNNANWKEPIPWDDRCFLNKTTSLCDAQAIEEFRYCYQGNKEFPVAVFLASDGIDDSFGAEENMVNFYVQILKKLKSSTNEEVYEELATTLPQLSKIGSQDDMSISLIYDSERIAAIYPKLLEWQIKSTKAAIDAINSKIVDDRNLISSIEQSDKLTAKSKIDLDYATTDLNRLYANKIKLIKRIDVVSQELYGKNFNPYTDDVGTETTDTNEDIIRRDS